MMFKPSMHWGLHLYNGFVLRLNYINHMKSSAWFLSWFHQLCPALSLASFLSLSTQSTQGHLLPASLKGRLSLALEDSSLRGWFTTQKSSSSGCQPGTERRRGGNPSQHLFIEHWICGHLPIWTLSWALPSRTCPLASQSALSSPAT